VVIPTFRAPELAVACVAALSPIPEWGEVIVVDDASGDDTIARVAESYPAVAAIQLERNLGFGGAVNAGFEAANAPYLAAVNNDVHVDWDTLAAVAAHLDSEPAAGAASPGLVGAKGERQRVGFGFPRAFYRKLLGRRHRPPQQPTSPYPVDYAKGACVLFRRTALEQVGLFDQQYWMFAEEIDLSKRLADAGWQTWVVPQVSAEHHSGRTTRNHPDRELSSRFRTQSYRSLCRYWNKHCSPLDRLALRGETALRVAGRIVVALYRAALRRGDAWWVGEHCRCFAVLLHRWPSHPYEPRLRPLVAKRD
jgi:GT2 family glycosyltransferase